MKKFFKTALILVSVLILYLVWISARPLEGRSVGKDILTESLCVSQSFLSVDCEIGIKTNCSNLACVSSEDYERCIKPGLKNNQWSASQDPSCSVGSDYWLNWGSREKCSTKWYRKRDSWDLLGFKNAGEGIEFKKREGVPFVCENPKSEYRCECSYRRLIY